MLLLFFLANCNPGCENGGICSGPNVCDCPTGYSGNRCHTRMLHISVAHNVVGSLNDIVNLFSLANCDPECENGGVCSGPNVCDCPTGYSGDQCQTRRSNTRMLQKLRVNSQFLYSL